MKHLTVWIALTAALACVASGCGGGPSKDDLAKERASYVVPLQEAIQARELGAARRVAAARESKCRKRIGGFVSALRDLDSVLNVGVTLTSYSDELGRARIQYDRIGGGAGLDSDCASAARTAESAFDTHIDAYNYWRDCLAGEGAWAFAQNEYGYSDCEFDWIEGSMQSYWRSSSKYTAQARRRLDAIGTKFDRPDFVSNEVPINDYTVAGTVYSKTLRYFCATDVPLDAQEPCTDLKSLLEGGISDGELDDLNDDLEGVTAAYGLTPKGQPAQETPS